LLEAWKLPDGVLAAVPDSPYAWPGGLAARLRSGLPDDPVTGPIIRRLAPAGGTVLDVGAGYGRLAVQLASEGYDVTAVEPSGPMAAALGERAAAAGLSLPVIEDRWPAAAAASATADVVVSANVVYDVWEVGPFLSALDDHARLGVVVELTAAHPWDGLRSFYRDLHGVALPDGPAVDDLVAVVVESVGVVPRRIDWESPPSPRFTERSELLDFYRIRLCVPARRLSDLEVLLEDRITETASGLVVDAAPRRMATLWWEV
jgi:SAM-dependent methyltransferase